MQIQAGTLKRQRSICLISAGNKKQEFVFRQERFQGSPTETSVWSCILQCSRNLSENYWAICILPTMCEQPTLVLCLLLPVQEVRLWQPSGREISGNHSKFCARYHSTCEDYLECLLPKAGNSHTSGLYRAGNKCQQSRNKTGDGELEKGWMWITRRKSDR